MATKNWSAPSIAAWPRQRGLFGRLRERLERLAEAERDQLPLWLPVGLGLGIAAWFALPDASAWTVFLLLAAALAMAAAATGWNARWGRAIAIFSLVAAFGCGLIWSKSERVAAASRGSIPSGCCRLGPKELERRPDRLRTLWAASGPR